MNAMMNEPRELNDQADSSSSQAVECAGCPDSHGCRAAWAAPRRGPYSTVGLVWASIAVFLWPLLLAVSAALLARKYLEFADTDIWEAVWAGCGLLAGALTARLVLPLIKKKFPAHP